MLQGSPETSHTLKKSRASVSDITWVIACQRSSVYSVPRLRDHVVALASLFLCLHADRVLGFLKCARLFAELQSKLNQLSSAESKENDTSTKKMSKESSEQPNAIQRQMSDNLDIPSRTVVLKDASEIPNSYQMTPGGTMYSTTPGGTSWVINEEVWLLTQQTFIMNFFPL